MWSAPDLTARAVRHERMLVAASVAALAAISWWYVVSRAQPNMASMTGPALGALVAMWVLMMAAMMLPSAAPAILLYATVRARRGEGSRIAQTWIFLAGYLAVWLLFSIAAAAAQSVLTGASMAVESRAAQGALLVAAGLYQLSPFKASCLRQCRSPAQFLSRHWRPGTSGAVLLGLRHGAYCLGCCWLLMALLFVGGVMNILWIAALTFLVAAEKWLPHGEWITRATALLFLGWGIASFI